MHGEEKRGKRGSWTHRSINMVQARGRVINVGKGGKGGRRDGGRKAKKGKGWGQPPSKKRGQHCCSTSKKSVLNLISPPLSTFITWNVPSGQSTGSWAWTANLLVQVGPSCSQCADPEALEGHRIGSHWTKVLAVPWGGAANSSGPGPLRLMWTLE